MDIFLVEDNTKLRGALRRGLEATRAVRVVFDCARGADALAAIAPQSPQLPQLPQSPDAVLMDVQLEGDWNGIQTAMALRREIPRLPIVFYSIQDDDAYYRDFRRSGILSHYAYVKKSNYLLPEMILPLLQDARSGRSFIDPEIEARVHEVRVKDERTPMALLEPNELQVAKMLAQGLSNEQIAARMGFKDKRTIARTNGQIYAAWGLADNAMDEKIARTRAALIVRAGRLIQWDEQGVPRAQDERGEWVEWEG